MDDKMVLKKTVQDSGFLARLLCLMIYLVHGQGITHDGVL